MVSGAGTLFLAGMIILTPDPATVIKFGESTREYVLLSEDAA